MQDAPYKSISQVSDALDIAPHTLRFWETKFPYLNPKKLLGGQRFYNQDDIDLLQQIQWHLKTKGYTIKGVLTLMREIGIETFRQINNPAQPNLSEQNATKRNTSEQNTVPQKNIPYYGEDNKNIEPPLPMFGENIEKTRDMDTPISILKRLKSLRQKIS